MVGAKDIDQFVKTTFDLVPVICDIGCEIGPGAVRFLDRTIHVVAVRGRAEQRLLARLPILGQLALGRLERAGVDQVFLAQIIYRAFDPARVVE